MNIWVGVDISAYNHTVTTEWTRVSYSALAISANFMIKAQGETFSTSDWFEVFGAQSEVGPLTSYIPTTTTSATRAADIVTLPTASYFIYSDTASKSIKQLGSTIDYGLGLLPISAQYPLAVSFQYAIAATAPLSTADITYIDANPEALYDVQFNSLVLPSGFSSTDIAYFYDGTQGTLGSDTVWNIARTFTSRASTATYRDGGVLKYAAIDEARYEDGFLLSEESSTNGYTYSEDFSNAAWVKSGDITVSQDGTLSSDGTKQMWKINSADFSSGANYFYQPISIVSSGQDIAFSVEAKIGDGTILRVRTITVTGGTTQDLNNLYDTTTDTWTLKPAGTKNHYAKKLPNGAYQLSVTLTDNNTGNTFAQCRVNTTTGTYMYAMFHQIEDGNSYATSYIPTTTTTVTRAADLPYANDVKIVNHTTACNTTYTNESYGATSIKLIKDPYGRTYGAASANDSYWASDSRQAVTNWTITAPFTVTEECDGVTYTFTSDGNRYADGVADGTYTLPTGTWTLDDTAFDNVTSVSVRGNTQMINEVVIP